MSPTAEQLFLRVQELPTDEKIELIDAIIAGLEESDPMPLDAAWMEEIRKRSADFDAGDNQTFSWAEVQENAFQRIKNDG